MYASIIDMHLISKHTLYYDVLDYIPRPTDFTSRLIVPFFPPTDDTVYIHTIKRV